MKIVFLDAATLGTDIDFTPLRQCGDLTLYDNTTPEQTIERVGDAEVVITNKVKITTEVLNACPTVKLICEAATGTDNIDRLTCSARNIPVKNIVNYSTDSVAQLTLATALSLVCHLREFDAYVKSGEYSQSGLFTNTKLPFHELTGMTWGIIGMGNIGKRVASLAQMLGCEVVYYSTSGKNCNVKGFRNITCEELIQTSDIISIHAPMNHQTRNLINTGRLSRMKKNAILINMGRGGIVNEEALAAALDKGQLAAAALDVYTQEPLPADHPFLTMEHPERLLLTPHIGWASTAARQRLMQQLINNVRSFGN